MMQARIDAKLLRGAHVVQARVKMRWWLHMMTHQEDTISKGTVTTGARVQMKFLLVQAHGGWWRGVTCLQLKVMTPAEDTI